MMTAKAGAAARARTGQSIGLAPAMLQHRLLAPEAPSKRAVKVDELSDRKGAYRQSDHNKCSHES